MGSQVYLSGKELEHPHELHHHVAPKSLYIKILGALLFLTVVTVLVSEANLGPASLPVAMVVAVMKASLVVAFFMHLKDDHPYHLFVFLGTLLFIFIYFSFTMFDVQSRNALNDEQETFTYWKEQEAAGNGLKIGIETTPEGAARCEMLRNAHHGGGHGGDHGGGHGGGHGAEGGHGGGDHAPAAGHDAKAPAGHDAKAPAGH